MNNAVSAMSAPLFWVALPAMLALSVLLSAGLPHEPLPMLATALVWLGTAALVWLRWGKSGERWFARAGGGIVAAMLFATAYGWTSRTDVFIVPESCGCKAHPGSFWPLVLLWLGGIGSSAYTLSRDWASLRALVRPTSLKGGAWWLLVAGWTAVCIQILAANVTMEVLWQSLRGAGAVVGGIALFVGSIAALVFVLSYPHRRRKKRMQAEFAAIGAATKREIVELVERRAREGEFLLCYLPSQESNVQDAHAKIGGNPLALPAEPWPAQDDGTPALFMLQVPLMASRLPAPWQGRLMAVYMSDWALVVKSYGAGDLPNLRPAPNPLGEEKVIHQPLRAMALPYVAPPPATDGEEDDDDFPGLDAGRLLERIPELRARLQPFTKHCEGALAWILGGSQEGSTYWSLAETGVQVGGVPYFIQGEHDPHCEICGARMRFLFQFEDAFGKEYLLGDAGLGYVYGCDAHPGHCQGFVDCY